MWKGCFDLDCGDRVHSCGSLGPISLRTDPLQLLAVGVPKEIVKDRSNLKYTMSKVNKCNCSILNFRFLDLVLILMNKESCVLRYYGDSQTVEPPILSVVPRCSEINQKRC